MASGPFGISTHKLGAALLLAAMAGVLLLSARLLGGPIAVMVAAIVLAGGALYSPRIRPAMLLRFYRAHELEPSMARGLHEEVAALAARAGLRRPPKLYLVNNAALTAFSVGTPADSAIGISHRLLYRLEPRELVGIVAHEMSHIVAGDVTLFSVGEVIARLVRTLAFVGFVLAILFGALGGGPVSLTALLFVSAAPLGISLIQFALSRNREYDADRAGAQLTGDPLGLANALQRIETDRQSTLARVLSPFGEQRLPALLRTHPPTAERIARLLGPA